MRRKLWVGLGAAAALATMPAAQLAAQQPAYSAQALADRAAIADLLTRYYNGFGNGVEDKVGEFYAEDGEMILGKTTYKGIAAIKGAYAAVPANAPQRSAFALNILISNLLVSVHGDTATARLVFTETITEKQGEAPKILTQGREFDHLVKRRGRWLIASRQIMGATGVPAGWQD
jgi:ketosteroid isomerase-like protein